MSCATYQDDVRAICRLDREVPFREAVRSKVRAARILTRHARCADRMRQEALAAFAARWEE